MIPSDFRLPAAEAYSKASAGGASFEQAFWKALEAVSPLIAAQAWDEGHEAGGEDQGRVLRTTPNPYRSQP
jgi:hypothetical protein